MKIKVTFMDWNNVKHIVEVTPNMCEALENYRYDIDKLNVAFRYVERRYTEMTDLISLEIIER